MSIKAISRQECPECGCETLHTNMVCRECGHVKASPSAIRRAARKRIWLRSRVNKTVRDSVVEAQRGSARAASDRRGYSDQSHAQTGNGRALFGRNKTRTRL